jgi:hypothetical protein
LDIEKRIERKTDKESNKKKEPVWSNVTGEAER